MVLRVVNGEVLYSDTTNRMIICYDNLPLMDYKSLYDNFGKEKFSSNLFHSYIARSY